MKSVSPPLSLLTFMWLARWGSELLCSGRRCYGIGSRGSGTGYPLQPASKPSESCMGASRPSRALSGREWSIWGRWQWCGGCVRRQRGGRHHLAVGVGAVGSQRSLSVAGDHWKRCCRVSLLFHRPSRWRWCSGSRWMRRGGRCHLGRSPLASSAWRAVQSHSVWAPHHFLGPMGPRSLLQLGW